MTTSAANALSITEPEPRALRRPRLVTEPVEVEEQITQPRVLAIDSRPVVRSGLARLARRALNCGAHTVSDLDQAFAAVQLIGAPPRALLLGIRPGDDPERHVSEARALRAPVILVLETSDPAEVRAALAAGADGYLILSEAGTDQLRELSAAVEAGERFIPDGLLEIAAQSTDVTTITARCLEVLRSLSEGLYDHEIADRLGISTSAVRKHIAGAQERLQARTRTQVVAMVARNGLL